MTKPERLQNTAKRNVKAYLLQYERAHIAMQKACFYTTDAIQIYHPDNINLYHQRII